MIGYERLIEQRIIPELGAVPLGRLSKRRIQAWVDGQEGSAQTVRNAHAVLRRALSGIVGEVLAANPAIGVELPDRGEFAGAPLTAEEASLERSVKNHHQTTRECTRFRCLVRCSPSSLRLVDRSVARRPSSRPVTRPSLDPAGGSLVTGRPPATGLASVAERWSGDHIGLITRRAGFNSRPATTPGSGAA